MKGEEFSGREQIFAEKFWHVIYDPIHSVRDERYKYIRNLAPRRAYQNGPQPDNPRLPDSLKGNRVPEETESHLEGAPKELSIYVSEAGRQPEGNRLRRFTIRVDGFVSVNAPLSGGELITKPIIFGGSKLLINFSTSAAGSIRVEVQDTNGEAFAGLALTDCHEIYGDQIERAVNWQNGGNLERLAGMPIRLRFVMRDADLYSICFSH